MGYFQSTTPATLAWSDCRISLGKQ